MILCQSRNKWLEAQVAVINMEMVVKWTLLLLVRACIGRYKCECQASKHSLVNNCRSCGRVVCEQEGSGPCFFCHALVCWHDLPWFVHTTYLASSAVPWFVHTTYLASSAMLWFAAIFSVSVGFAFLRFCYFSSLFLSLVSFSLR